MWKEGYAPFIVMAGSGTVHHHKSAWGDFEGKTEAEVFAAKAIEEGRILVRKRKKRQCELIPI